MWLRKKLRHVCMAQICGFALPDLRRRVVVMSLLHYREYGDFLNRDQQLSQLQK